MNTILQIFWQSLVLSFQEIRAAKLRSFLSLLGIGIGILCVISVRTAVSSLEINIQSAFNSLGSNIIYVQKWPWQFVDGNNYTWWKYINRPSTNQRELEQLQQKLKGAEASSILYFASRSKVISGSNIADGAKVMGVSFEYNHIKEMDFSQGRYFTAAEASSNQAVALIGDGVAQALFPGRSTIEGEKIKINGVKVTVIGVLKKEGSDLFGFSADNNIIVPFTFISTIANVNDIGNDPLLAIIPKKGVPIEELKYEMKGAMRSIRKLSPYEEDNFALNQISVFADGLASVFVFVNFAGLFIGGFSIFVGAFGIANIMFVAVKERTPIIGIKKAIGARKIYILLEFLLEAVVLCIIGGTLGLLSVITLFQVLQYVVKHVWESDFQFYITTFNVVLGISISVVVGILAGFIPAWSAANMKPVDAIRST